MRHLAPPLAVRYDGARASRNWLATPVAFVCDRSKSAAVYHSRSRISDDGGLRASRIPQSTAPPRRRSPRGLTPLRKTSSGK
jgi:hypothetical protein